MKSCLVIATLVFAACGGSELAPGAGDDPGKGTNTLVIDGSITARNKLTNAHSYGEFDTDVSVRVTLNGQTVQAATVTVTSETGTVPLTFRGDPNRFQATIPGYDEVFVLDVKAGPDEVTGVRVDGPDLFSFSKPTAGATVDATMPMDVAWSCDTTADSAAIDAGDGIDALSIEDSGEFSLPANTLRSEKDKTRTNTLRITRTNRVTPAGAVGGSEMTVSITNEIDVIAMANPTAP